MNITIFGSGYVGLVTGTCFADTGHKVTCVDVDQKKIEQLNQGNIPIYEPGLEALVEKNRREGLLYFTGNARLAIQSADIIFIAVGTPSTLGGQADLSYVYAVADTIAEHMTTYKVIVSKSTVPVGTAESVKERILNRQSQLGITCNFDICSNPEFLKEGSAIEDFTRSARIIIGTDSERVVQLMSECYAPYNRNRNKLMFLDIRAAELTKYAANAILATKISFMNEIANLAECLNADIEQVRQGIGSDPRIGFDFIYPGCGYGGSCFPKDVNALLNLASDSGIHLELLKSVQSVNERQKHRLFEKLNQVFQGQWENKTIAIWGLSFKPNTDDMREAPSRVLMESIWHAGGRVQAFDPVAMPECRRLYHDESKLTLCDQRDACLDNADALVICTEWKAFRTVDFNYLKQQLRTPVIVDGRNLYEPKRVQQAGLLYYAVGRGNTMHSSGGVV